ncbi:MAG: redoxin family protein [Pirellulales bacterium]
MFALKHRGRTEKRFPAERYAAFRPIALVCALIGLCVHSGAAAFAAEENAEDVARMAKPAIGSQVESLRFTDIRGLERSLDDFGKKKAYVLVFTTTQCPLVRKSIPKLTELIRELNDDRIAFVAVNVGMQDSIRDMAAQAIDLELPCPIVKDADAHAARALGITRTPETVVINEENRIVYRGRIDDQLRLGGTRPAAEHRELKDALAAVLDNQPITVSETPVDGCLISRSSNESSSSAVEYFPTVATIMAKRCVTCHRPDTAAPFSLVTAEDAVANAEMIAETVSNLAMPPWYAHTKHGKFQNDCSLTAEERSQVIGWVRGGCVLGQSTEESRTTARRVAEELAQQDQQTDGWHIGKPDLIVSLPFEQKVPATGFVPYRYALLPHIFTAETWVEAFEIRPRNPAVVHHCNMAYVTAGGAGQETFITGYVPGGQPMDLGRFHNGTALRLPAFCGLALQIHLTTTGKPERCMIDIGLRFPKQPVHKQLQHFILDPHNFRIPPYAAKHRVQSSLEMDQDIDLLGLFTHMHVRGTDMTFTAERPNGDKEVLLQIPNYNFNWQLGYEIEAGTKKLPKKTKIEAVAHFDNSTFNPYNPDPAAVVRYGPQTVDEMFNGYGFYVASDEDLDLRVDPKTGQVAK